MATSPGVGQLAQAASAACHCALVLGRIDVRRVIIPLARLPTTTFNPIWSCTRAYGGPDRWSLGRPSSPVSGRKNPALLDAAVQRVASRCPAAAMGMGSPSTGLHRRAVWSCNGVSATPCRIVSVAGAEPARTRRGAVVAAVATAGPCRWQAARRGQDHGDRFEPATHACSSVPQRLVSCLSTSAGWGSRRGAPGTEAEALRWTLWNASDGDRRSNVKRTRSMRGYDRPCDGARPPSQLAACGSRDSGSGTAPSAAHWRRRFHVSVMGSLSRRRSRSMPRPRRATGPLLETQSDRRSAVQRIVCAAGGLEGFLQIQPTNALFRRHVVICASARRRLWRRLTATPCTTSRAISWSRCIPRPTVTVLRQRRPSSLRPPTQRRRNTTHTLLTA